VGTGVKRALRFVSDWGTPALWLGMAVFVVFVGWFFVMSANEPRWPFLATYLAVLWLVLRAA
jgi:hypothetical protein